MFPCHERRNEQCYNNRCWLCGRDAGRSGKTQRRGLKRSCERQLRPSGLLQIGYIWGDIHSREAGVEIDIRTGNCSVGDDFQANTHVCYSLNKQNRWHLLEAWEFELGSVDQLRKQSNLDIFLIRDNFTSFRQRRLPTADSQCVCNLQWIVDARQILRLRAKEVRLSSSFGFAPCGSYQLQGGRQKLYRRCTRKALSRLKEAREDTYAQGCTRQLRIRTNQSCTSLINLFGQVGMEAGLNGDYLEDPVYEFLHRDLAKHPKLIFRSATSQTAKPGSQTVWRTPKDTRRRHRSKTKQKHMRQAARQEAADGLEDWLLERDLNLPSGRSLKLAPYSPRYVEAKFIEFSLESSRSNSPADGNRPHVNTELCINKPGDGLEAAADNDEEDELEFRAVLAVSRHALLNCGGQRSDSWPLKIWLRPLAASPGMSMARRWLQPAVVVEELPGSSGHGLARVRLHLLGCEPRTRRRQLLCRMLACEDPLGSLPQLLSDIPTPSSSSKSVFDNEVISSDEEEADSQQQQSRVRISALTLPPLYSWLYTGAVAPSRDIRRQQVLPPLKPPMPSASLPATSSASRRRQLDRLMSAAACGTCGVACPRPQLCQPADWLSALVACGHWHCHNCWLRHVTRCVATERSAAVPCPTVGCGRVADSVTVLWFAPSRLYHRCLKHAAWEPLL